MPHDPELIRLFTEALRHHGEGNWPSALLAYRRIQVRFPDFPDAWANASALLAEMGRFEDALAAAERAAGLAAPGPAVLFNLARAQEGLGRIEDAMEGYRGAIGLDAAHAQAMHRLAELLCRAGRFGEAREAAALALEAEPGRPRAHYNMGLAHQGEGRADEAAAHYRMAVGRDAGHAAAAARLASIYIERGHFGEAAELCRAAGERSATPSARSMLLMYSGNAKVHMMDFAGAEADLALALELEPGNASVVHQDLVYLLALQGRYGEAWGHARAHRGLGGGGAGEDGFGKPRWNGGPLEGGTLLVRADSHSVGGYGDAIQFSRFFPRIRERCGCRLFLYTYRSLRRLMDGLPGLDGVVADGDALPHFDAVTTAGDLPCLADADLSDLPPPARLLPGRRPGPPIPGPDAPAFRVGLVWAGSASTLQRAARDMDPRLLDALAGVPGAARIAWYGLQKRPDAEPPGPSRAIGAALPDLPGFTDLSPWMGDFLDTAQIAAQLDLVATVDTSMAHLAGSLGVPTAVLLPYLPDWRWGLGGTTPWYPAARLIRQASRGDWGDAVERLKGEIRRRMRNAETENNAGCRV